ncbi:tetratricopeptide repeat protein [Membranihabitans marinus]|uniref:tetratricopeptide repeat protein n=1 Tax=Membranihabitans marinus TaxID=1227546 RepID=UPI001F4316BE|nr:tetratricopeptide repeat protein [Membranihabitans marinus]
MNLTLRIFSIFMFFISFSVVQAQDATPASMYNDGVAALKAKDYDKALDLLTSALEAADPEEDKQIVSLAKKNSAVAAYYAGNAARKAKDYDSALEKYETGISVSPSFYANYIGKALSLNSKGDVMGALQAYIVGSGEAEKVGKADKAEEMMDKATIFVSKAYTAKKWDETLELGKTYLESTPSADVHFYMARAYKEKGNLKEALANANKAIELGEGGKDGRNYFAQAEVYEGLGDTSAALEAYKKVPSGTYGEMAKYKVDNLGK